ncbi:MAG: Mor transcription activator family protein [Methylococcaceae bacterium]
MDTDAIEKIKQDIIETALSFGHSQPIASDLAMCAAKKIMKSIGGSRHYIPKSDISERNEKIKAEFNGKNKAELLKKYAVSKSTFYSIIPRKVENDY